MIFRNTCLSLLLVFLCSTFVQSQSIPHDEKAVELVTLGKSRFKGGDFLEAALTFDLVLQRPFNRVSTLSLFYSGLSYYRINEFTRAEERFSELEKKYPESKYVDDAQYTRALMMLESSGSSEREKGLDLMIKVLDRTYDQELKDDIMSSVRHFTYKVYEDPFLNLYYIFVKEKYKWLILEAICFHLDENQEGYLILDKLKDFEEKGGILTPYLSNLKEKYDQGEDLTNYSEFHVAVVLSFHLKQMDTTVGVPKASLRALELYEGMQLALDSFATACNKKIKYRVYDTKGDAATVDKILEELAQFRPDVVVGEISTSLSQKIGEWCEKNRVVQLVPRNPLNELIDKKRYVFLVHSSISTHGNAMAEWFYSNPLYNKVAIFSCKDLLVSDRFAKAFVAKADSLGKSSGVTSYNLSYQFDIAKTSIPGYVSSVIAAGTDAVYLPMASEEINGLIVSEFYKKKAKIRLLGTPEWESYTAIDPEIKSDMELTYTTMFYDQIDSVNYERFNTVCLKKYANPPTNYNVMGFDIMSYLLKISNEVNSFNPLADAIRKAKPWKGLHQEFFFNGKQDNQHPNILQYKEGRIISVQ